MAADIETTDLHEFLENVFDQLVASDADFVAFTSSPDSLQVTLSRQKTEVTSSKAPLPLLKPLTHWLYERYSIFQPQDPRPPELEATWKFLVTARLGEHMFSFLVSKTLRLNGTTHIIISNINRTSIYAALERFGLHDGEQQTFLDIFSQRSGIFLLSSPTQELLKLSLSALVCFSGTREFTVVHDPSDAANADEGRLTVLATRADEPVDAALRARSGGVSFDRTPFLGSLCHGLIRRVCPACARESAIDPGLLAQLPDILRGRLSGKYKIGRGCDRCGHSGYDGYVGIRSFVPASPEFTSPFLAGADHSSLIKIVYSMGILSLLEDGLQKVNEGVTTLEALYNCIRVLPEVYLKYLREGISATAKPLDLPEDFFSASEVQVIKPATGREAFVEPALQDPLSQPVIESKKSGKALILLVEDDPDQRHILELLFKNAGYDIAVASDGIEAYAKIERVQPDLIVSDLMMPKMDGSQLVRKIRSNERYARLPILMLTVVSDVQKEYELLDLGADDYCEKTIQRKILLKRVENLLKRV